MDWITHDEDVWFDFRGDSPKQLTPGRYYKGTVDGFADFGVFVDLAPGVTGLLHRSELDRRLESLDWESGDTVFVQVKNVRSNGNIDLGWSIRQSESEFRGARVHDPDGDDDGEEIDNGSADDGPTPVKKTPKGVSTKSRVGNGTDSTGDSGQSASATDGAEAEQSDDGASAATDETSDVGADEASAAADAASDDGDAAVSEEANESDFEFDEAGAGDETEAGDEAEDDADATADTEAPERVTVDSLGDRVGELVRIEGEIVGARQTGGPTIFEVRDETAVVDCAAFVEAGVRAYPEVDEGDLVRLDGEVELRRGELQVETEELTVLADEEADTVEERLEDALSEKARPETVEPLADDGAVAAVTDQLADAAEAIRTAVLQSRPIVVRHAATADGYVAGAAIERAVLPLIREEHARADAEYHFFTRRPLDDPVYGMDAATNDVTRMLQDSERHDEKLPLVVLVGVGGTTDSLDGLGLLGVYGASRVVVDAEAVDTEVVDEASVLVSPSLTDVDAASLSTGALGANLAAAVNADASDDLAHLPAVSYWQDTPQAYADLASEAGYDADRTRELRQAVALEAYYQSYQDKRELITDLLFEDDGGLAGHVSEQFRIKLDDEVETAEANLETREVDGASVAVLDADSYSHRFDFPPTSLLADALHRRADDDRAATVVYSTDELFVRAEGVDVRTAAADAREAVPEGGITAVGIRQNRVEFLSGAREDVVDAVAAAVVDQL
ncbi:DHH family phosphoesterase [Halobellus limi]|uniref:RecJ-like exonuclease, contains DnaJ-type Zn finger domain n=1 Tax=Halobellus limi TaxID=699433 RepID=A0A1H6AL19_9EURY|nr:OB-fold nucleic acid binding domain-containing protein [Halobellus limi]QCC47645.1 S1 RNA-binding domain-containing protein [Halobellus limi]SEG49398.1 RecJ-like exonuclease, contains DnaJ-type Zn finger domain [Halobellus limi]